MKAAAKQVTRKQSAPESAPTPAAGTINPDRLYTDEQILAGIYPGSARSLYRLRRLGLAPRPTKSGMRNLTSGARLIEWVRSF